MDLGLEGKSAIVTGGSSGIGAAIALELGSEGCNVAINHLNQDTQAQKIVNAITAMGPKSFSQEIDVSDYSAAEDMVAEVVNRFGGIDILVCNAGINWDGVIWKMSEEQWDKVISVNLKGYFNYNKAAANVFKDQKSGKIVNISSINGIRGKHAQSNYSASKGGEIGLSKALAKELGKFHVNVNVVAPGMVMTDMSKKLPIEFVNAAIDETVLGRIADPNDIANIVTFLCSDKARHITGEVFKIDGGQYI